MEASAEIGRRVLGKVVKGVSAESAGKIEMAVPKEELNRR